MPKPPGTDGGIHFRRNVGETLGVKNAAHGPHIRIRVVEIGHITLRRHRAGARLHSRHRTQLSRHHSPFGNPAASRLVAAPAHVGSLVVENHRVWLVLPDQPDIPGKIILLLPAVRPLSAGAVEPNAEKLSVARQKLLQLIAIIIIVLRGTVVLTVSVPRGKIDSELQPRLPAGQSSLSHHIPLAGGILHAVLRVLGRPETESVMMLCRQHHPLHPCCLHRLRPLAAVQLFRVENTLRLCPVPPFPIREGIHAEMDKGIKPYVEPCQLTF